jgi:hypothetical protein
LISIDWDGTQHIAQHRVLQEVERLRLNPGEVAVAVDAVLSDESKGQYWVLEVVTSHSNAGATIAP